MSELVSVIMPVRDAGGFLAPAVGSILEQTHQELELLLVDDHSQDRAIESLDLCDPRLKLMRCQGEGVAAAFNTGLQRAQGDLIARMDADDVALPNRLERQLRFMRNHPDVDIAGGCVEIFSDRGVAGGNLYYQEWLNSVRTSGEVRRQLFVESPIPNPTALFRRAALEMLGGYADPPWPEDYDLYLRADAAGMRMAKPDAVVLRWRDHDQRLTRTDSRYAGEAFQRAKAHYLLNGRINAEGILIWGAGPGGRLMHDLLTAQGAVIEGFVDVHPRRQGGTKRGLPVWPIEHAAQWDRGTVLVAVGARGARSEIRAFLDRCGRCEGRDYLFVA